MEKKGRAELRGAGLEGKGGAEPAEKRKLRTGAEREMRNLEGRGGEVGGARTERQSLE